MALPCALFSSSAEDFNTEDFVKYILQVTDLPQPKVISDQILSYDWKFETKYYRTTIQLCTTDNRTIGDKDFAQSVEAFIHFFDPNVLTSFERAKAWLPYLKHIEPEVQMLVCRTSKHSDVVGRKIAQEWCIQNGFELVELEPEIDKADEDDDFPETIGMARIVQALHAHTWPNLEMKNSPTVQSQYVRQMMKEQHIANKQMKELQEKEPQNIEHTTNDDSVKDPSTERGPLSTENEDVHKCASLDEQKNPKDSPICSSSVAASSLEDEVLKLGDIDWRTLLGNEPKDNEDAPLTDGDVGVEDFEQLFMKLKVMKDKAENLTPEERRKYAEKVAVSFWKAIGGDEDEIEGLDGDSD
ncbi:alpha- and gamma-adaptin-binding protein p34-like [Physella acuta]|uniref:alpha- and gamma-adaptin-binding protein p34-like n=1 Tax=Physella acuta TaxID=109671 RepID=UPI0027DE08BF|nr:alpha- and gamma-adaptin-binding protein p34-like [Physella acuta]